jgi:hypothetical protein
MRGLKLFSLSLEMNAINERRFESSTLLMFFWSWRRVRETEGRREGEEEEGGRRGRREEEEGEEEEGGRRGEGRREEETVFVEFGDERVQVRVFYAAYIFLVLIEEEEEEEEKEKKEEEEEEEGEERTYLDGIPQLEPQIKRFQEKFKKAPMIFHNLRRRRSGNHGTRQRK